MTVETLLTADPAAAASALPDLPGLPADGGAMGPGATRPPHVPEAFWDARTGTVRVAALLRAYHDLERRLGRSVLVPGEDAGPEDWQQFHRACGVPDCPEGYGIETRHPLLGPDPDLNTRLHAHGFTPAQAQLVYDLAAERVLPVIEALAADFEADRQLRRLVDHFGGEDRWREVSRQLLAWGRAALPAEVMQAMGSTYEGVLALHRMMQSADPGLRPDQGNPEPMLDEEALRTMMRDPRYWRQRDPAMVRRISAGFSRLYGGE